MNLINKRALQDAIDCLDWWHIANGELKHGAASEETALYKAQDIYRVIDEATVKAKTPDLFAIAVRLNKGIEVAEFSTHTFNALHRWGIRTIGDLYEAMESNRLPKIRGIGEKSIFEINHFMDGYLPSILEDGGQDD